MGVNDAGVTLFGRLEQVSMADARRLFDTSFWGLVHGTLAALPELKKHDLAERGDYPRQVFETTAYTKARLHTRFSGAAFLGAGLIAGGIWSVLSAQAASRES